jgi:hypothetical protein
LRFGDAGVAYQQDVDVPSQSGAVGQHFLHPSQQQAQYGPLDVLVSVDRRRQRLGQQVEDVLVGASELFASGDVFSRDARVGFFAQLGQVVGDHHGSAMFLLDLGVFVGAGWYRKVPEVKLPCLLGRQR